MTEIAGTVLVFFAKVDFCKNILNNNPLYGCHIIAFGAGCKYNVYIHKSQESE